MKVILWESFEIIVNFYQSIIMLYFPFKYLGGKYSNRFVKNYGIIFACLLMTVISIFNCITAFEHICAFFYLMIIFIYSFSCLKNNIYYKIFASVYSFLIVTLSTVTVFGVSSVIFGVPYGELLAENDGQRLIVLLSIQFLILYTTHVSLNLLKNNHPSSSQLSKAELLLITVILLTTIIMGALLCFVSLDSISEKSRMIIAVGFVCLIVINIVILYIILDLKNKNYSIMESEKIKLQLEYNRQYVENAKTEYELIRKLRHDTKNIYDMLGGLLRDGEVQKAEEYINKVMNIADERETFIKTKNNVANSIINARFAIAKSFGINVTCLSIDNFEGIDDIDLCRLLSNMIENAVSATSCNKIVEKEIILRITEELGQYIFLLKNSIDESVIKSNPELLTSKKEKSTHGYGTKIIRDIAKNYHGRCDFFEEDDMFCCLVVLNTKLGIRM